MGNIKILLILLVLSSVLVLTNCGSLLEGPYSEEPGSEDEIFFTLTIDVPEEGTQFSKNDIITFRADVSTANLPLSEFGYRWICGSEVLGTTNPLSLNAASDLGIGIFEITFEVTHLNGTKKTLSFNIEILDFLDTGIAINF